MNGAGRSFLNCGGDISKIKKALDAYFKTHIPILPEHINTEPQVAIGFQRVLQRALLHIQSAGRKVADAGDLLASLFNEKDCHAVYFLKKEGITRLDVLTFISHGISGLDAETRS